MLGADYRSTDNRPVPVPYWCISPLSSFKGPVVTHETTLILLFHTELLLLLQYKANLVIQVHGRQVATGDHVLRENCHQNPPHREMARCRCQPLLQLQHRQWRYFCNNQHVSLLTFCKCINTFLTMLVHQQPRPTNQKYKIVSTKTTYQYWSALPFVLTDVKLTTV